MAKKKGVGDGAIEKFRLPTGRTREPHLGSRRKTSITGRVSEPDRAHLDFFNPRETRGASDDRVTESRPGEWARALNAPSSREEMTISLSVALGVTVSGAPLGTPHFRPLGVDMVRPRPVVRASHPTWREALASGFCEKEQSAASPLSVEPQGGNGWASRKSKLWIHGP